ncbi:lanthionine synthetase LanC family protein [Ornithinimicrobium sp. W1665]|uniref:lanthionine synthetase LanC family protein n=1 Tax=Ornithinimicrobium sp. W1665 TaxID=3416666 RepID=UPI003CEAC194
MAQHTPDDHLASAERAWRWVLDQVRRDDGPWIPWHVDGDATLRPPWDRDGMHSGVGGLAHALAEIRLLRTWSGEERDLAQGIADRVRRAVPGEQDCSFFDGLVSHLGVLTALGDPGGAATAVTRLLAVAGPAGWPMRPLEDERIGAGATSNDLTLGTAGVLLGALWGLRKGVPGSLDLADRAAGILLAEAEQEEVGLTWRMVPPRHVDGPSGEMPNLSHGVAGVATALALAGCELERPDLLAAAEAGAAHLVSLADQVTPGLTVPCTIRPRPREDDGPAFGWCHGSAGTSLLFLALQRAGTAEVAARPPLVWHRRCLYAVRHSGVPARVRPGFWDNDGRCCGTAGVGEVFLDAWQREGRADDLGFAVRLADALLERAVHDGPHTYWRFVEHRAADPLLPPGVGWMQGAAGIAAHLFRVGRVLREGSGAATVARMDNWWAVEPPG